MNGATKTPNRAALIIKAGGKSLLKSLLLCLVVIVIGAVLADAHPQLGMIFLLGSSFALMAKSYHREWRLLWITCLLPPVAAALSCAVQYYLVSKLEMLPDQQWVLLVAVAAVAVGIFRGSTHQLYVKGRAIFAQRTLAYLAAWLVCYAATQLFAYAKNTQGVQFGLLGTVFTTVMLTTVAIVMLAKYQTQREKLLRMGSSEATVASLLFAVALAFSSATPLLAQQPQQTEQRFASPRYVVEIEESMSAYEDPGGQNTVTRKEVWTQEQVDRYPINEYFAREDASGFTVIAVHGPFYTQKEVNAVRYPDQQSGDPPNSERRKREKEKEDVEGGTNLATLILLLCFLGIDAGNAIAIALELWNPHQEEPSQSTIEDDPLPGDEDGPLVQPPEDPELVEVDTQPDEDLEQDETKKEPEGKPRGKVSVVYDESGNPLIVWQPDMYEADDFGNPGGPGMVWYVDQWLPPDEAQRMIDESAKTQKRWDADADARHNDAQTKSKQSLEKRVDDLEKEAQKERKEKEAWNAAWDALGQIDRLADKHDFDDILGRSDQNAIGPDGSIDVEYVAKLKELLRNRLNMDQAAPDGSLQSGWGTVLSEWGSDTWNDARRNPLLRIGFGALSGGSSEIFYQSQAALDAMQRSFDDTKGRNWDLTDALRAGYRAMGEENLPLNTLKTLQNPEATWSDVLANGALDVFVGLDTAHTLRNLRGSYKALRNGAGAGEILRYDNPLNLFGRGGKDVDEAVKKATNDAVKKLDVERMGLIGARNVQIKGIPDMPTGQDAWVRNLSEGTPIDRNWLHETGYSGSQIDGLADVAKKHDVIIGARTTNMDSMRHIRDGTAVPKTLDIKSKTINKIDSEYLGYTKGNEGMVGFRKPKEPTFTKGESPQLIEKVQARHKLRLDEYNGKLKTMEKMAREGKIKVVDGTVHKVIDAKTSKPYAGDIDAVYFKDAKTGRYLTGHEYLKVRESYMKSRVMGQHGAEYNVVEDLTRKSPPGTLEGQKMHDIATKVRKDLSDTHRRGLADSEVVVEMRPDGILRRGPRFEEKGLPDWTPGGRS